MAKWRLSFDIERVAVINGGIKTHALTSDPLSTGPSNVQKQLPPQTALDYGENIYLRVKHHVIQVMMFGYLC